MKQNRVDSAENDFSHYKIKNLSQECSNTFWKESKIKDKKIALLAANVKQFQIT